MLFNLQYIIFFQFILSLSWRSFLKTSLEALSIVACELEQTTRETDWVYWPNPRSSGDCWSTDLILVPITTGSAKLPVW